VSLAIAANVLRVLGEHGMRVRDLLGLSGVSEEGISMAILAKRDSPSPCRPRTAAVGRGPG
jgi:hypothetical protein